MIFTFNGTHDHVILHNSSIAYLCMPPYIPGSVVTTDYYSIIPDSIVTIDYYSMTYIILR